MIVGVGDDEVVGDAAAAPATGAGVVGG